MEHVRTGIELAGMKLKNPLLLASGTAGYGTELASIIDLSSLGGIILKSVTLEARGGNPEPRIWETCGGMLNSIGLENVGMDSLAEEVLPSLGGLNTEIIVSIAGDTVRSYARMAARLTEVPQVSAFELNVSCPNVERGGILFGVDSGATAAVMMAVRENTDRPIFAKLSAAVTDISRVAEAAIAAGASGLSLINTIPGLAIDPVSRRPRLGAVTGGLSGPAIKPVALKAIWDCYRSTRAQIIGGGGVYDARDVVEFLLAGATAVAVGTAMFKDPQRPLKILEGLPAALSDAGAASPAELVGALRV